MRILLLICIMISASSSQIPTTFTLISKSFESEIFRTGSQASILKHSNFKADCTIFKDSCSFTRINLDSNVKYAEGLETFKVNKDFKKNVYIIERTNCSRNYRYILDFNNNTFIGGQIYCTYDVSAIGMEVCIEKGTIMVSPKTNKIDIFSEESCNPPIGAK